MRDLVKIGMLLLAAAAVPAAAVPIKYTIAGTFSGSLNGTGFTGASLAFTAIGDTAVFVDNGSFTLVPVTLTVTDPFGTGKLAVTDQEAFGVFPAGSNAFFSKVDGNGATEFSFPIIVNSPSFTTYSGVSSISTTPASFNGANAVGTSRGFFALSSGSDINFAAMTVPEPASWILMVAGFGLVGAGLRSRRRVRLAA